MGEWDIEMMCGIIPIIPFEGYIQWDISPIMKEYFFGMSIFKWIYLLQPTLWDVIYIYTHYIYTANTMGYLMGYLTCEDISKLDNPTHALAHFHIVKDLRRVRLARLASCRVHPCFPLAFLKTVNQELAMTIFNSYFSLKLPDGIRSHTIFLVDLGI